MLRGLGTAIALPSLNAMASSAANVSPPTRIGFFYVPNGVVMDNWRPDDSGTLDKLPAILRPLETVKNRVTVISNLAADHCIGKGAGHEPSTGGFLVGKKCKHSEEPEVGGISVDQLVAREIGVRTKVDSLALGIDPSHRGDHGYSGTYLSHMSWRSRTTPAPLEVNPRLVFDRLFGGGTPQRKPFGDAPGSAALHPDSLEGSVLDLVREDTRDLQRRLGFEDRRKLEQYLEGLRAVERRIAGAIESPLTHHAESFGDELDDHSPDGFSKLIRVSVPDGRGIPESYPEHVELLTDLLVLAFQTDATRVASFMFSQEKSGRQYREIDIKSAHHSLSHHEKRKENLDQLTAINTHHMRLFARMLEKMQAIQEGERTLLDNTVLLYGSGLSDGNKHNHDDLPVLIAGGAGGTLTGNRHIKLEKKTPICNVYVDMLQRVGVKREKFGDSTGRLDLS
jgi:hypothetical protein